MVALNVSYLTHALGEVGRSCAIEMAVRQNTKIKPYPQPVKVVEQQNYVFGSPVRGNDSGGGTEDGQVNSGGGQRHQSVLSSSNQPC